MRINFESVIIMYIYMSYNYYIHVAQIFDALNFSIIDLQPQKFSYMHILRDKNSAKFAGNI